MRFKMYNANMLSVIHFSNNNNELFNRPDINRNKIKFSMNVHGTFNYTFCYFLSYEIDIVLRRYIL